MNNFLLSNIKTHKYLGVILGRKMSWIQHIAYVKNELSKGIGIMFKAITYLDGRSLISLYNAYIYSYLIYCVESWGNALNCHLYQLYIMHKKRIVRLILFLSIIKVCMYHFNLYLENSKFYRYIILTQQNRVHDAYVSEWFTTRYNERIMHGKQ